MIFSSTVFLFLFLPVVLLVQMVIPQKHMKVKNILLLAASLLFYAWGEPKNVLLMLFSILCNYFIGLGMGKWEEKPEKRRMLLILSLVINLGVLFFFKYFNFVTGGIFPEIALPIGISFFTFQIMSYTIDVYRGDEQPQRSLLQLALYISLFPQLIAGPIVRYGDIARQLTDRVITPEKTARGMIRFAMGLAKKVILSNTVAVLADTIFALDSQLPGATAWLGVVSYALQIYFDFSGYSDMAIGMGHMFGFDFLENFNYPYISCSVREFWRRWHISLSTWFRDYLYIPLGGSRKGQLRTYLNLLIVFAATGLWHGASWNFLVWGLYHGAFLVLERVGFGKVLEKLPRAVGWIYTMVVVLIGWVFFRGETLGQAIAYLASMFRFGGLGHAMAQFSNLSFFITLAAMVLCTPVWPWLKGKADSRPAGQRIMLVCEGVIMAALVMASVLFLSGADYNPFIYFRF